MQEEAKQVMAEFTWGEEFLKINEDCLVAYAACSSSAEVVEAQQAYLEACEEEHKARSRRMELPSFDSDEEEEEEEGDEEEKATAVEEHEENGGYRAIGGSSIVQEADVSAEWD